MPSGREARPGAVQGEGSRIGGGGGGGGGGPAEGVTTRGEAGGSFVISLCQTQGLPANGFVMLVAKRTERALCKGPCRSHVILPTHKERHSVLVPVIFCQQILKFVRKVCAARHNDLR